MKRSLIILLSLNLSTVISQNWLWAVKGIGNAGYIDSGRRIVCDSLKNLYLTGTFTSGSIKFGSYTLFNQNNSPGLGPANAFITKLNSSGSFLWAKGSKGNTIHEYNTSIACDQQGNSCVTGCFKPLVIFDNDTLITKGAADVYIVKYDYMGNVMWSRSIGENDWDVGNSVSFDKWGNIYVVGAYKSQMLSIGNFTLSNNGDFDMFIIKLDANGSLIYAKTFGGIGHDVANYIYSDFNGDIIVGGRFFSSTLNFGNSVLVNSGTSNLFVAKFDANGNNLWAKAANTSDAETNAIVTDENNNIYVTGAFYSPNISFDQHVIANSGWRNLFLWKMTASGTTKWAKGPQFTSPNEHASGFSASKTKNGVLITGFFNQYPIIFQTFTLTPGAGSLDTSFLTEYDSLGNVTEAKYINSAGNPPHSACVDIENNQYISGGYQVSPFFIGTHTLTLPGPYTTNVFVAKYESLINNFKEHSNCLKTNIFPNPTEDNIEIVLNELLPSEISLIAIDGRLLEREMFFENRILLSTSHLSPGIYFLNIKTEKGLLSRKIIRK